MTQIDYPARPISRYAVTGAPKDIDCLTVNRCKTIEWEFGRQSYASVPEEKLSWCVEFGRDPASSPETAEFCRDYEAILRHKTDAWRLIAFKVFPGVLELFFTQSPAIRSGHDYEYLFLVHTGIEMNFTGPRGRFGITPKYVVSLSNDYTLIEEDLGFMRREIILQYKEPKMRREYLDDSGDMEAIITEYTGI